MGSTFPPMPQRPAESLLGLGKIHTLIETQDFCPGFCHHIENRFGITAHMKYDRNFQAFYETLKMRKDHFSVNLARHHGRRTYRIRNDETVNTDFFEGLPELSKECSLPCPAAFQRVALFFMTALIIRSVPSMRAQFVKGPSTRDSTGTSLEGDFTRCSATLTISGSLPSRRTSGVGRPSTSAALCMSRGTASAAPDERKPIPHPNASGM